jgi:DnaK suppressor protein
VTELQTDRFRDLLLTQRAQIEPVHDELQKEHSTPLEEKSGEFFSASVDDHLADLASDTYDREMDFTLEESVETVLGEIDAALKRIDDGTYGICEACGRPIPSERLEARPWATLCIEDQRRRELG